jgi:nucleoid-associated protein YgaU
MSVASEFPPEVYIPERARATGTVRVRHLALVATPGSAGARSGRPSAKTSVRVGLPRTGRLATEFLCVDELSSAQALPVAGRVPLRMTRRGVVTVVALTVAAAFMLLVIAHASAGGISRPAAGGAAVSGNAVTVQAGDTLWSIAGRTAPGKDPRLVVDHLRKVNHLTSASLTPGQTLNLG